MKAEKHSALRQRMIEDMTIRRIGEKAQSAHIRGVKHLAAFWEVRLILRHAKDLRPISWI